MRKRTPELASKPDPVDAMLATGAKTTVAERRLKTRYPVTAAAGVIELSSGARLSARTTDLSESGCYLNTLTPFPAGTGVRLRLTRRKKTFESLGVVLYSQHGMGMGVAFTEISPDQFEVLRRWLGELSGELAPDVEAPDSASRLQQFVRSERVILDELIRLLIQKGILTDSEASALLRQFPE